MADPEAKRAKTSGLVFVTGNPGKLKEVQMILGEEFELSNVDVDLPELQGEPVEISVEKCKLAAAEVGGPVIVEDTSLCFNGMGGLPGPYIKWFLSKLGHDGLNKMLEGFEDKTGAAVCVFAYCEGPGKEPMHFVGKTEGTIVPARGPNAFGWDPIFEPAGFNKTFAEMTKEEKNEISHRRKAVELMREYFKEHNLYMKAQGEEDGTVVSTN